MPSTKEHWENIYKTRDHQQVGWYQHSPEISLTLLSRINAQPSQAVIDVGCGASALADNLIEKGFRNITLVDLSETALSAVKTRLADNKNIPTYLSGDITQIPLNKVFDVWHDRAVFHFLTDSNDRKNYFSNLDKSLSESGRAIIGTFSLAGVNKCSGLDVVQYDENKMNAELNDNLVLEETITDTHIKPSGDKQEYMYFIIKHKDI